MIVLAYSKDLTCLTNFWYIICLLTLELQVIGFRFLSLFNSYSFEVRAFNCHLREANELLLFLKGLVKVIFYIKVKGLYKMVVGVLVTYTISFQLCQGAIEASYSQIQVFR